MPVDDVLGDFDGFMNATDHFEFYWVPHTRWALTKRNTRTQEPAAARARGEGVSSTTIVLDERRVRRCCAGSAAGGRARSRGWRRSIPSASSKVEYTDRSDKVFTSPRLVHFYEMEYAIPREAIPRGARTACARSSTGSACRSASRSRCASSRRDDIPLSTAYGRDTGYIAVHVYWGTPYDQYFQGVEAIMDDYGGRPHWGKMHFQTAATLAPRYPRWDAFQAVRAKLDPEGRFANPYLDRVLGPVSD